jgi:hypothetical protein
VDIGIFTLNCLHTSAGLTVSYLPIYNELICQVNENADP